MTFAELRAMLPRSGGYLDYSQRSQPGRSKTCGNSASCSMEAKSIRQAAIPFCITSGWPDQRVSVGSRPEVELGPGPVTVRVDLHAYLVGVLQVAIGSIPLQLDVRIEGLPDPGAQARSGQTGA
jgi:hypothetical protein